MVNPWNVRSNPYGQTPTTALQRRLHSTHSKRHTKNVPNTPHLTKHWHPEHLFLLSFYKILCGISKVWGNGHCKKANPLRI